MVSRIRQTGRDPCVTEGGLEARQLSAQLPVMDTASQTAKLPALRSGEWLGSHVDFLTPGAPNARQTAALDGSAVTVQCTCTT